MWWSDWSGYGPAAPWMLFGPLMMILFLVACVSVVYLVMRPDRAHGGHAMEILKSIGLADKARAHASELSQVELRKLELARAMAARPKLLISDEAMAGLAGAEVDEVLKILFDLNAQGITIIMIEHIMQAVMRFSQRVVCLDAGRIICE